MPFTPQSVRRRSCSGGSLPSKQTSTAGSLAELIRLGREVPELEIVLASNNERARSLVVDTCELLSRAPAETAALFEDFDRGCQGLQGALAQAIRFAHVPPCLGASKRSLAEIKHSMSGQFAAVTGLVTRMGAVNALERSRAAAAKVGLGGSCMHLSEAAGSMMDFQELRLQDPVLPESGCAPRAITVLLADDLVGTASPGDSVVVGGVVRVRWQQPVVGRRLELQLIIEANHIRQLGAEAIYSAPAGHDDFSQEFARFWAAHCEDKFRGRSAIVKAVAPSLYGMEVAKLALLLVLIGAPSSEAADGDKASAESLVLGSIGKARPSYSMSSRVLLERWGRFVTTGGASESISQQHRAHHTARTQPHLLLAGDPGAGKSHLLQAAYALSTRGVRTSGVGATRAGLTCTSFRDNAAWGVEAGALALADGGVCCIDEFGAIDKEDRAALHEAMEQQTISVAKPGLVCQLRSRCSIIAAQNWANKENWLKDADAGAERCKLSEVTGLPESLLSRFDLILILRHLRNDTERAGADADIADSILGAAAGLDDGGHRMHLLGGVDISHRTKEYVAWAQRATLCEPMEDSAQQLLECYYTALRRKAANGEVITVRTFESLLRLSQAHARLMSHGRVRLEDAVAVVFLHQICVHSHGSTAETQVLTEEAWGPMAPEPLRQMTLSADVRCRTDYEAVEGSLLWALGLQKGRSACLEQRSRRPKANASAPDVASLPLALKPAVHLPPSQSWGPLQAWGEEDDAYEARWHASSPSPPLRHVGRSRSPRRSKLLGVDPWADPLHLASPEDMCFGGAYEGEPDLDDGIHSLKLSCDRKGLQGHPSRLFRYG